jgi:AcrR family transcriptional regulator
MFIIKKNGIIFLLFVFYYYIWTIKLNWSKRMNDVDLSKEEIIKAEVIVASQQLFKRYGYQKTTMEDIARAIGRGKSTLYYYYKSKEEIFEAIVLKELKEVLEIIVAKVEKVSTAEEKLLVYTLTAYQVIKEKAVLNDVIFNEMIQANGTVSSFPSMMEHLDEFNKKWFLIVQNILVFGVENKEFSLSMNDIEKKSNAIFTGLLSTVLLLGHNDSVYDDSIMPVQEILMSFVDILINGLK